MSAPAEQLQCCALSGSSLTQDLHARLSPACLSSNMPVLDGGSHVFIFRKVWMKLIMSRCKFISTGGC